MDALRWVFLSYARLGLEKPDDYRVLFMTPERPSVREGKAPNEIYRGNPAFAVGLDRVRACVAAGLLAGDPHAIATMLWTTVHGAVAAVLEPSACCPAWSSSIAHESPRSSRPGRPT